MTQRPSLTPLVLLLLAVLAVVTVVVGIGRCFTVGNATWRVRQVFPGAVVDVSLMDPEKRVPRLIRTVIPSYSGMNEKVTFSLTEYGEPLDLPERLSRLSGVPLRGANFTRCRITRLCPAFGPGFPGIILFTDCDFSALSPEDGALLQKYGQKMRSGGMIVYGAINTHID